MCTRAWVSRDSRWHIFAARFLDFVVLTEEHLVLCSTGFFSRRPRRQVLREPLNRLFVTTIGPEPARALRIVGAFSRPIRLELRERDDNTAFIRELRARTPDDARLRGDPWATSEMVPTDQQRAAQEIRALNTELEQRVADRTAELEVAISNLHAQISQRTQAETALRDSEARYRRLVELSPEPIVVHADNMLLYVNTAAVRMFGARSPEELIGSFEEAFRESGPDVDEAFARWESQRRSR